ncbi:ImmA/IrrE family metallo-endopeptidase [Mycetocola reblochoni]|uniref:ImmA/IrrE family metallo-endopeptidase n=1 Tax=Mycetocola reblochoni TaxID=331618 RepID=A0A3L6ZSJ3_9MICO|nr:ImmA/IrrE family metallo-endopeptidase [Mycetocola reblochoni]RLP70900.1 ImmA/IrrE family metallo-endopeptidase [Mycetocola reblochoni]
MTSDLFELASVLNVTIEYSDLSDLGRDGDYNMQTNTIRLRDGMSHRLHRSVLAHELAHAKFGDTVSQFGPVNAKQEKRADEWAAARLIHPNDYRVAEYIHDGNVALVAQALDVVPSIVHAYQRTLLRCGDTLYEQARMGAGQWSRKMQVGNG